MNMDMNFWILTIMDLSTKLEYYAANLDKRIEKISVCLTRETKSLCYDIMELNDKKILLVNLKVLYDALVLALKSDERFIIGEYAKNQTMDTIAKVLEVNRSTVMRRLNRAVKKCAAMLVTLGYSAKKLHDDYSGYCTVYSAFKRIKNEYNVRKAAAAGNSVRRAAEGTDNNISPHGNCAEPFSAQTAF